MKDRKTVLVVDDSKLIRTILRDLLQDEYQLIEAQNGLEAMELLKQDETRFAVVLLDIVMPKMDGFQVLVNMKKMGILNKIPVIIITAEEAERYISLAYDMGVSEVIHKPFNKNVIKKRVRNLVDLYSKKNDLEELVSIQTESIKMQTQRLIESNDMMIDALSTVIEYRSLESGQHIRRIRGFTKILLEFMAEQFPEYKLTADGIDMISSASAMHDIGKIAIPDSVLLKPGKLTDEEFEIMKTHTVKGGEILYRLRGMDNQQFLAYCHDICLYHHERWDGKGYPDGLIGDEIPINAQVVSIADVYDALTHKRVYKPALTSEEAVSMILNGQCGAFSPKLLQAFLHILPELEHLSNVYSDEGF